MLLSVVLSSFFIPREILPFCIFDIGVPTLSRRLDVDFVHTLKFTVLRKYWVSPPPPPFTHSVTLSAKIQCIVNSE